MDYLTRSRIFEPKRSDSLPPEKVYTRSCYTGIETVLRPHSELKKHYQWSVMATKQHKIVFLPEEEDNGKTVVKQGAKN